jgi:hypothetical protein
MWRAQKSITTERNDSRFGCTPEQYFVEEFKAASLTGHSQFNSVYYSQASKGLGDLLHVVFHKHSQYKKLCSKVLIGTNVH